MPNCQSCGAPLPGRLINGRFACEFCRSLSAPAPLEGLFELVVDLGREAGLSCPVCEESLGAALIDGERVAWCRRCQGLLFDDLVFAAAVQSRRAAFHSAGHTPPPFDARALDRRLTCSRCRRLMQVHPYHGPGNVAIDSCFPCGLIWVDAGELTQIEQAPGRR